MHFPSDVGSFEGFVYGHGLNPDSADFGVGGVLGVIFCKRHLEKVSGKMCENVHISASSFCFGLSIQNDFQAAAYLRDNGYGHHPVLSRTLLYIIHISIKGGSCGRVNDYRVVKAQTVLDMLREAPEQDLDAIKVAMKKLKYAIELRDITSEGKSKGGSCGGDNDYCLDNARAKVEKLLKATVVDKDAIEAAMKELVAAVAKKDKTARARVMVVSISIRNKVIHYFTHSNNYSLCQSLVTSSSHAQKGKTTTAESFNTLKGTILQSENKGGDFEVRLQELIDWKEVGVPKRRGIRTDENKLYKFRAKRLQTFNSPLETLASWQGGTFRQLRQNEILLASVLIVLRLRYLYVSLYFNVVIVYIHNNLRKEGITIILIRF